MKTTKRIIAVLLFAITMTTVLNSCSKESTNERKIIGKWIETNEVEYIYDGEGNLLGTENCHVGDVYEFKSDGSVSIDGFFRKYSINGDELVVGEGNMMVSVRIVELTNSTMIWEYQTEDIFGFGVYSVYRTVLEKQ